MLVRHLCVLPVSFLCLELCIFLFDCLLVHALGSIEKGCSKTSLLLFPINLRSSGCSHVGSVFYEESLVFTLPVESRKRFACHNIK